MMIRYFSIFLLFSPAFLSAQKYGVQKVWLFSKVQYSGNVPIDKNGNQQSASTNMLQCFLKVSKNTASPDWQTAYYDGNMYTVIISPVTKDSVIVGTLKNTKTSLVVKDDPDTKLVELVLTRQGVANNGKPKDFIIKGTLNNQGIHLESREPVVELSPVLMQ